MFPQPAIDHIVEAHKHTKWMKESGKAAIHHFKSALNALKDEANPSRIPVAEKHLWIGLYDLANSGVVRGSSPFERMTQEERDGYWEWTS